MGLATMLGEAWERAGAPKGLFGILNVDNDPIEAIIEDKRIAGVTLTGSPRAGAAVAALAGKYAQEIGAGARRLGRLHRARRMPTSIRRWRRPIASRFAVPRAKSVSPPSG